MSTVKPNGSSDGHPFDGVKVVPHHRHVSVTEILADWAGDDPERWRLLAVLALREVADWRLRWIGLALGGLSKGRISQLLAEVSEAVRGPLAAELERLPERDPRRGLAGAA